MTRLALGGEVRQAGQAAARFGRSVLGAEVASQQGGEGGEAQGPAGSRPESGGG